MYSESRARDLKLFSKAIASNLLARFAPSAYVRLTGQTGRGSDADDVEQIATYFERCVADYREQLEMDPTEFADFLHGRCVLEYGPGDVLGVALILFALGARYVHCVDRFPLQSLDAKNSRVYARLIERMPDAMAARARAAFVEPDVPMSGLRSDCIDYRVTPDGLADEAGAYDIVISRAVLEHVNSLEGTFVDIERSLVAGGVSLHSVDLRSHNLDRDQPFDFLTWPHWAYRLMYSHKGFPNRWRVAHYREMVQRTHLRIRRLVPTAQLSAEDVARIRPHLAGGIDRAADGNSPDELAWLGFWLLLEKAA